MSKAERSVLIFTNSLHRYDQVCRELDLSSQQAFYITIPSQVWRLPEDSEIILAEPYDLRLHVFEAIMRRWGRNPETDPHVRVIPDDHLAERIDWSGSEDGKDYFASLGGGLVVLRVRRDDAEGIIGEMVGAVTRRVTTGAESVYEAKRCLESQAAVLLDEMLREVDTGSELEKYDHFS